MASKKNEFYYVRSRRSASCGTSLKIVITKSDDFDTSVKADHYFVNLSR